MANMTVTPDSSIRLLRCPLRLDNLNQLTFDNVTAQTNYFLSLPYLYDNNLSYIRKDGVIRVSTTSSGTNQLTFEDLITYNYVMYKNTHYENKWFYAYITNIKYINDGCTEISIETDYFQTWQFDLVWKNTFIEREHVNNDTIGLHTIPENVEMGEYKQYSYNYESGMDNYIYLLASTTNTSGQSGTYATMLSGIPYTGYIYAFTSMSNLAQAIQSFGQYQQNIYAVWMCSRFAIDDDIPNGQFSGSSSPHLLPWYVDKSTALDGYTPVNKKLLTYPYQYLLLSNNNGSSNILKYEGWSDATKCSFDEFYSACVGGDVKMIPHAYESVGHSEQNGLLGGKYPTLSWSQDLFTAWVSQNGANLGIGQASAVASIVGGVGILASGGGAGVGVGMIGAGIMGIASSMAQVYQHSMDPNSARGNTNGGSANVGAQRNGFYAYRMGIKQEYAEAIDKYLSAYGYKVNRIGTPHIHVRANWDYLKTINCNLGGNIPDQDLKSLCNMLNTGMTFWHNPTNFLNYSASNTIL